MREYTDEGLRRLYREWSEDYYAAGWMNTTPATVQQFVDWLRRAVDMRTIEDPWQDYEVEGVAAIRKALREHE